MPVKFTAIELPELGVSIQRQELVDPTYEELVDHFERIWIDLTFTPARHLLETPNHKPAAISLLCPYYETYAKLKNGIATVEYRKSPKRFRDGFRDVFSEVDNFGNSDKSLEPVIKHIYKFVRCALAHQGILDNRVFYPEGEDIGYAFFTHYKRSEDKKIELSDPESIQFIVVNVERFFSATVYHFDNYVKQLRSKEDPDLCDNFGRAFRFMVGC